MRSTVLAITLLFLSLAAPPRMALAQNNGASPDFDLAYVLATASYCAYAVGEADADGGEKRAVACLNAAADQDSARLAAFQHITQDKVEAFYDPNAPENAYLMIQTGEGVILAFRGTLTPPIIPSSGGFPAAVGAALEKYNAREATLLKTFITDWKNNFMALPGPGDGGRHPGFNKAWSGLRAHLIEKKCAPADCSKFLAFVSQLQNTGSPRLFITGHSKGGALAVLATLDLPPLISRDVVPVVYTFAGAKVLTANAPEQSGNAFKGMWRFEHENDIVPSLPPDGSVLPLTAYAHVGNRAFFRKGQPPEPSLAPVPLDDRARLTAAAANLLFSGAPSFNPVDFINPAKVVDNILSLAENNCEALVHNHFLVFSNIQELVHAQHAGAPLTITEGNLTQSFFFTGLPDEKAEILWGYSQWCRVIGAASAK